MKIRLLTIITAILISASALSVNTAAAFYTYSDAADISTSSEEMSISAEETMWYYKPYNGGYQKRLWSITNAKWLTEWIDC